MDHHVTILDTTDMVEELEKSLGHYLATEDHLELFKQICYRLDNSNPFEISDKGLLDFNSLVFANYLKVDHDTVNRVAYRMLVQLWQVFQHRNFYVGTELMYFPFSMNGKDLCIRRYNS